MVQYLAVAFIDFVFAYFALKRKDKSLSIVTGLTAICYGVWSLELYFLSSTVNIDILYLQFISTRWGINYIPFLYACLVYILIGKKSKNYVNFFLIPLFAYSTILYLTNLILCPSRLKTVENGYLPETDFISYGFFLSVLVSILLSLVYCVKNYQSIPLRQKGRFQWFLIFSTSLWIVGFAASYLAQFDKYLSDLTGAIASIMLVSGLFYISGDNRNFPDIPLTAVKFLANIIVATISTTAILFVLHHNNLEVSLSIFFSITIIFFLINQYYSNIFNYLTKRMTFCFSYLMYDLEKVKHHYRRELNKCDSLTSLRFTLDDIYRQKLNTKWHTFYLNCHTTHGDAKSKSILNEPELLQFAIKSNGLCLDNEFEAISDFLPNETVAVLIIKENSNLLGVLISGQTQYSRRYTQSDIEFLNWLGPELQQVTKRIISNIELNNELSEANKSISLIELMNHYHHDIKAPLSIIEGLMITDIYSQDVQRKIILEQIEYSTQLITTMADILRGDHKREKSFVDIGEIIKNSSHLFSNRFEKISSELPNSPLILGNQADLKILFVNLIKNAYEAKVEGRLNKLFISINFDTEYLKISLCDNGCGMSSNQLDNIWSLETTKSFGTGIGLQVIKRIVDEHNGIIKVKSKLGEGTCFLLKFKL